MYETRLLGSGGRTEGLAGLGGPSRGPLDVLLNGAVGLLLAYLVFALVEPFWMGAVESTREVKLESDVKVLVDAFRRYEIKNGAYKSSGLDDLSPFMSMIPQDPWGRTYRVDAFFARILSGGEDGVVGQGQGDPRSVDDRVGYYRPPWRLWLVLRDPEGRRVPYEMNMDGEARVPVAGNFPPEVASLVQGPQRREIFLAAPGADGTLDLGRLGEVGQSSAWLATGPGDQTQPALNAEETMVYFTSVRDAPSPLIYRVPAAGGAVEQVTEPPEDFVASWDGDRHPALEPNTGHLAFDSIRIEGESRPRICLVPRGEPLKQARPIPDPALPGTRPTWSSDGKRLFYLAAGGRQLIVMAFPPRRGQIESIPLPVEAEEYVLSPSQDQVAIASREGDRARVTIVSLVDRSSRVVMMAPGGIVALALQR